jgi:hypothetical protein
MPIRTARFTKSHYLFWETYETSELNVTFFVFVWKNAFLCKLQHAVRRVILAIHSIELRVCEVCNKIT